jgi:putative FmdB family regulatory protein
VKKVNASMPTYDYRCTACGARFEAWQKFTDEPIRICPECSGPAQRVIHAPAITFKGSGFYSTDSRASTTKEAATPAPSESAPAASESGSESAPKPSATSTSESAPSAAPAKPAAAPSTN